LLLKTKNFQIMDIVNIFRNLFYHLKKGNKSQTNELCERIKKLIKAHPNEEIVRKRALGIDRQWTETHHFPNSSCKQEKEELAELLKEDKKNSIIFFTYDWLQVCVFKML
jgi:hypothetical protein